MSAHADHPVPDEAAPDGLEAVRQAGELRWQEVAALRATIERSGLFDADWYRRHHLAASDSDLPALDHYLTRGVAAGASPGPLFDAPDYLRHAWHLRRGIDDPLTHYLVSGFGERRRPVSVARAATQDPFGRQVEPIVLLPATSSRPSIAVVVHVFYADLFDEIAQALALMPYRFTLLVTTDAEEKATAIAEAFARRPLDAHLVLHVAANRGRNFGPFLQGFGDALAAHDLMLHLHTKKSLYTGGDRRGWRQTLLRTLLPATAGINFLIERFVGDPKLGVLTASPGEEMRYWSYSWLSNRHLAQPLFDRLGLTVPVPHGMFDYPHGGMFWARPRAIAKLISHPWELRDFPPELGQTDGTLMHAIERIVVLTAADAGFGFAELEYERGVIRPGWSSRNLEQYYNALHDGLLDTVGRMETISFDVFDTLLTRICLTPDAVHRYVGVLAARRFPGADDYVVRRRAAEAAARLEPDGAGDVDLDQIQARFRDDAGEGWTEDAARFVQDLETALDLRTLRPRAVMIAAIDAARAAGKRVVLTSDSYLPRRLFDAMLERFGLAGKIDAVYLSSERRARKDRGDLWPVVAAAEPGLLHVGDNEQSDIHRTADAGIRHFHVMSPRALFEMHGLVEPEDGPLPLGDDILLGWVACTLFNSPYLDRRTAGAPLLSNPEQAGAAVFGPLLFAFVAWIASHPATRHLERLHFVSREGYFLKRLYDAVRSASGRDDLPPSAYFHCSRRAALGAMQGLAAADAPLDVDAVLRGAGYNGSLDEFFLARLGLEPDPRRTPDPHPISLPRDDDLVRCMMELRRPEIVAHGARALAQLRAYAMSHGLGSVRPLGFVDVGYSATMQTALQAVMGRPLVGLYMGVSHAAAQVRAGGGHAFGAFADGNVASFTGGYGLMLEAFLTAPHGQVIGYDDGVSPPAPRFRHDGLSQHHFPTLERLYQGAERYALELIECWGPELLELPFRRQAATAMLEAVRIGRLRLAPGILGALSVEDDFCGNGEIDVFGRVASPGPEHCA